MFNPSKVYDNIPLPLDEFLPALALASPRTTFLDAGCGEGEKLGMAQDKGYKATGIEIRPELADIARSKGYNVITANAAHFEDFANYDCVFTFHLFIGHEAELAYERYVMQQMNPGATLLLFGLLNPARDNGWIELGPNCWRKPWL